MTKNELDNFKDDVGKQYLAFKEVRIIGERLKKWSEDPDAMRNRSRADKLLFRISMILGIKTTSKAQAKRPAAAELIHSKDISEKLCRSFLATSPTGEIDDDMLVETTVTCLMDPLIRAKHSIPANSELIGAACDEISRIGVAEFCKNATID